MATAMALRDLLLATERPKQSLDAALRRFVDASSDDSRLLSALLDASPQADPLVHNWPDEIRKGTRWEDRESVALFLGLMTQLLHVQTQYRHTQEAAEVLALKIVRDKSTHLEKMLSWSDKPIVEFRVLELMAAIVDVSATCARELVRIFDFQSASFTKIASRRLKKTAPTTTIDANDAPERDSIALSTTANAANKTTDKLSTGPTFQIRAAYIRLVAALAACPDKSVHRFALKDGGVIASLFKALDGDDAEMLATVINHIETLVLKNDNVDVRGQMAILNNSAIQQLIAVIKSDDEDAASQAWTLIEKLLFEEDALYRVPARQAFRLFVLKSSQGSSVDPLEISTNEGNLEVTHITVKIIRGVIGAVGLNEYVRSSQVRTLVTKLLMAYPGLVYEFISSLGPQLEPKPGYRWFCIASMIQNVLSIPLDAILTDIQSSTSLTGDSAHTFSAHTLASRLIMPLSCRKELSRGLQHTNNLIIYSSLGLIESALRRFQFVQSQFPSLISRSELESELRFLLPSSETLVSLLMKLCAAVENAALVYLRGLTVFRLYLECLPQSMSESKADFTKLLAWQYLDGIDGNTSRAMQGVIVGEILRVLMVVDETRLRYVVTSGTLSNGEVSKLSQLLRMYATSPTHSGEASRSLARAVLFRVFSALKVFGSGTSVSSPSEEINVWLDNMVTGGDATSAFLEVILQDLLSEPFAFLSTSTEELASPSPSTLALIAALKNNWPNSKSASKLQSILKKSSVATFASRVLMSLLCRSADPILIAGLICGHELTVPNDDNTKPSTKKRRRSDSVDWSNLTPLECVILIAQAMLTPPTARTISWSSTSTVSEWKPVLRASAFGYALFDLHPTAFVQQFGRIAQDLLRLQVQPKWLHHYIASRPDVDLVALTEAVNSAPKKDKPFLRDLLETLPLHLISQRILFALSVGSCGDQATTAISKLIIQLQKRVNPDRLHGSPPHEVALVAEQVLHCIQVARHVESNALVESLCDTLLRLQVYLGATERGENGELGYHRLCAKVKKSTLSLVASTSKLNGLDLIALANEALKGLTDTELVRLRHPGGTVVTALLARGLPIKLRLQIVKQGLRIQSKTGSRCALISHIIKTLSGVNSLSEIKNSQRFARRLWSSLIKLEGIRGDSQSFHVLSAGLHVIARVGGVTQALFQDSISSHAAQYLRDHIDKQSENQHISFDELVVFVRRLLAVVRHRDIIVEPSPAYAEVIEQLLKATYTKEHGRPTALAVLLTATYGTSYASAVHEHVQERHLVAQAIDATVQLTSGRATEATLGLVLFRHATLSGQRVLPSQMSMLQSAVSSITKGKYPSSTQILALLLSLRRFEVSTGNWPIDLAVYFVRSAVRLVADIEAHDEQSDLTLQSLRLMLHDLLRQTPANDDVRSVVSKVTSDVQQLVATDIPSGASGYCRFIRASRVVTQLLEQKQRHEKISMKGYSISDHFRKLTSHELFSTCLLDSSINIELLQLVASMLRLGDANMYSRSLFQHLLGAYNVSLSVSDRMIRFLLDNFETKAGILASQYGYRFGSSSVTIQPEKQDGSVRSDLIEDSTWLFSGGLEPTRLRATIESFPLFRRISVKTDGVLLSDDGHNAEFDDDCADVDKSSRPLVYDPSYLLPMLSYYVSSSALSEAVVIQQGVTGVALRAVSSNADDVREYAYAILAHVHESLSADAATDFKPGRQVHLLLDTLRNALQEPLEGVSSVITVFLNDAISILCRPGHTMYPHVNHFLLARPSFDLSDVPMFYSLFNSHSPQTYKQERSWLLHGLRRGVREDADVSLLIRRHVPSILLSFFGSDLADDHTQSLVCSILVSMLKTEAGAQYLMTKCAFIEWLTNRFHEACNVATSLPLLASLGTLLEECLKTEVWDKLDASHRRAQGSAIVNCFEAFMAVCTNRRALVLPDRRTQVARTALLMLQRAAMSCSLSTYESVFSLDIYVADDKIALDCIDLILSEPLSTHPEFQKSRFSDWGVLLSRITGILVHTLRAVLSVNGNGALSAISTVSHEIHATELLQRLRAMLNQAPTLKLVVVENLNGNLPASTLLL